MKTAGQLLQEKRLEKELSLADIAQKIKVKPEYLTSIENSDFASLPGATHTKGFLRNYAEALRLNPDTIVAMFRRDFEENSAGEIVPRGLVEPLSGKRKIPPASTILLSLAVLAFLGFLSFQLLSWLRLPPLSVIQPIDGDVYGEKVTVKGKTSPDSTISINNQKVIVSPNGEFSLDLLFPAGSHSVIIQAVDRQGKTRLLERTFTVSK